eukprot:TRINITY_DN13227_c0_g1_i1.p1 TRINITY_DN13227_c0_g1~~TRINITY_DN13227_c0_g1_i1.p1  ORF type:complete len:670 (-),score=44.39 TRINITY_DN13227_c0_g1_i1:254-2263(-)
MQHTTVVILLAISLCATAFLYLYLHPQRSSSTPHLTHLQTDEELKILPNSKPSAHYASGWPGGTPGININNEAKSLCQIAEELVSTPPPKPPKVSPHTGIKGCTPIFILSHNKLTTLKYTLREIERNVREDHFVIVIDNHSLYPPTLEFLKGQDNKTMSVLLQKKNFGDEHLPDLPRKQLNKVAPGSIKRSLSHLNDLRFTISKYQKKYRCHYYVVTDPDVALFKQPGDAFMLYAHLLNNLNGVQVVGPHLIVDDIPDSYPLKRQVLSTMPYGPLRHFPWQNTTVVAYNRIIDTTFGLYKGAHPFHRPSRGLAVMYPYAAQHLDWYLQPGAIPPDVAFNMEKSSKVIGAWSTNVLRRVLQGANSSFSFYGGDEFDFSRQLLTTKDLPGPSKAHVHVKQMDYWGSFASTWVAKANEVFNKVLSRNNVFIDFGAGPGGTALYAGLRSFLVVAINTQELTHVHILNNLSGNKRLANITTTVYTVPCSDTYTAAYWWYTGLHRHLDPDVAGIKLPMFVENTPPPRSYFQQYTNGEGDPHVMDASTAKRITCTPFEQFAAEHIEPYLLNATRHPLVVKIDTEMYPLDVVPKLLDYLIEQSPAGKPPTVVLRVFTAGQPPTVELLQKFTKSVWQWPVVQGFFPAKKRKLWPVEKDKCLWCRNPCTYVMGTKKRSF